MQLNLDRSFAICHSLREFTISIDPAHTPELADARPRQGSLSYPLSPQTSPTSTKAPLHQFTVPPASPPQAKTDRRGSTSTAKDAQGPARAAEDPVAALQPATREWRRFLKKSHHLERITWGGRASVGTWKFEKTGTGALGMKIEFEPFGSRGAGGKGWTEVGGQGEEGVSPLSGPGGAGGMGGRRLSEGSPVRRRRRESEVSLVGTCLSGLDLSGVGGLSGIAGMGVEVQSPEEERAKADVEDGWGLGLNLGAGAVGGLAMGSGRREARRSIEKVEGWREQAGGTVGKGEAEVEPFAGGLGWAEPAVVSGLEVTGAEKEGGKTGGGGEKGHGRGKSESPPAVRRGGGARGGHRRTSTGAGGGGKGAAAGSAGGATSAISAVARGKSSGSGGAEAAAGAGAGAVSWADAVRNEEGWQRVGAGRK